MWTRIIAATVAVVMTTVAMCAPSAECHNLYDSPELNQDDMIRIFQDLVRSKNPKSNKSPMSSEVNGIKTGSSMLPSAGRYSSSGQNSLGKREPSLALLDELRETINRVTVILSRAMTSTKAEDDKRETHFEYRGDENI